MQPYMVVFIDTKGPALLGRYDDKGVARRAWTTCTFGAAIAQSDGTVLQFKGGTAKQAEKRLEAFARQVARETPSAQGKAPAETSAPKVCAECRETLPNHALGCSENGPSEGSWTGPSKIRVKVDEVAVEIDDEDDIEPESDDAPEPATEPAPAPTQKSKPSGCVAKGCGLPLGMLRANTTPAFRCLCPGHRQTARFRVRDHECTPEEAVAWLRENERPPSKLSAKKPKAKAAAKPSKPAPKKPAPKTPTRHVGPSTLNAALDAMRRNAEVVRQLGGIAAAEQHVKTLEKIGGPAKTTELIRTVLELAG